MNRQTLKKSKRKVARAPVSPQVDAQYGLAVLAALLVMAFPMILPLLPQDAPPAGWAQARTTSPNHKAAADRYAMRTMGTAIQARAELLKRSVSVRVLTGNGRQASWNIALKDHPEWVLFEGGVRQMNVVIDEKRIQDYLAGRRIGSIDPPQNCNVLALKDADENGVIRALTDCIAMAGYRYDPGEIARGIKEALETGQEELVFVTSKQEGTLADAPLKGSMQLLARGHTNFEGSGKGRKDNVKKALNEHLHNVYIPAGGTFSFADAVGGPVKAGEGWKEALTIFEGGVLRMALGGGMCQSSTTLYRAVLEAGLPILAWKNHSLYVTYYEKYGVGMDATVYPGSQDFAFANNTNHPLIIQSYNDGDEAYVNIYGMPDGRSIEIAGPYFTQNAASEPALAGRSIKSNHIAWVRRIRLPGQEQTEEVFVSRYKDPIAKSVVKRWLGAEDVAGRKLSDVALAKPATHAAAAQLINPR